MKPTKFTNLTAERINNIVTEVSSSYDQARLTTIANRVHLARAKYPELQNFTPTSEISEEQLGKVMRFLCDSGLAGFAGDNRNNPFDYIPGAEMMALLGSYTKNKEGEMQHEIRVVKNQDFGDDVTQPVVLPKTAEKFRQNNGIHLALAEALKADFVDKNDVEARTYLLESFGTTGLNHFVSLTVRKNGEDGKPIADLWCSSPTLIRAGLEGHQNGLAAGMPAQFKINATLSQVFGVDGFNYYHNLEPFQPAGGEICANYALEAARISARMTREEHLKSLSEHYRYPGPYGGIVDVDLSKVDEQWKLTEHNMPAEYMHLSGFGSYRAKYEEGLRQVEHQRKSGEVESSQDRINRYSTDGKSDLMNQKALRHRLHVFEIVNSPEFLALAQEKYVQDGVATQIRNEIKNNLMPARGGAMSDTSYDEETKKYTTELYLGGESAKKLIPWLQQQTAITSTVTTEEFSGFTPVSGKQIIGNLASSLAGERGEAMANLLQRTKISLTYSADREIIEVLKSYKTPATSPQVTSNTNNQMQSMIR